MRTSNSKAIWIGNLRDGEGKISLKSIDCEANYSYATRFGNKEGTNPEELIAAAHAGCFSMAFANLIANKGFTPEMIETGASVTLSTGKNGSYISKIELYSEVTAPDIDDETLNLLANEAKSNCPVSKALSAVDISLQVRHI
jgi:osmotically inducible protein OsmC